MDGLPDMLVGGRSGTDGDASVRTDTHHARLRRTVLDVSTSLMNAEPDEIRTKIEWGLGSVGEHVGAGRVYLFRARAGAFDLTTEWTADEVEPRSVRRIDLNEYGELSHRLEQFENVTVTRTDDSWATPAVRELLRTDDVRSAAVLPMVDDWSLVGFIGFDVLETDRTWGVAEVNTLRTAADVVTDSLTRVRRERELAAQNERLETFASVVSHDLRNPLNVVSGSIELAQAETDSEHLDRAARAADRMDDLIDQVLTLAREGEDISDTREVDLDHVVNLAWDTVGATAADLRVAGDLGRIDADPDRLQEALSNLFRNSVEHGTTGSRTESDDAVAHAGDDVVVRVGRSDDGFYVADDGPGIRESERDAVFDRGHTSGDGTGLGLAIVRSIVEAHGWEISVTDTEAGGARFDVTGIPE